VPIITLTTDMGHRDHYVGAVKGAILCQTPEALIVDISHSIKPFDNAHAAFVLRNAWPDFPKGTIHVIGVNPETDGETPHLVVRHEGHFFIGSDNGIFSLLFDGLPLDAFALTIKLDDGYAAFPTKNVFVKAACHLARGGTPEVIGRKVNGVREQLGFRPAVDKDSIRGAVMHVDGYGNVITNIHRTLFHETVRNRQFRIAFGRSSNDITTLCQTYGDAPAGERLALFGATGYLEIAVNKGVEGSGGGAARLFGLNVHDPVRVDMAETVRRPVNLIPRQQEA
jgi:S-adenosylmethionine hydrolase